MLRSICPSLCCPKFQVCGTSLQNSSLWCSPETWTWSIQGEAEPCGFAALWWESGLQHCVFMISIFLFLQISFTFRHGSLFLEKFLFTSLSSKRSVNEHQKGHKYLFIMLIVLCGWKFIVDFTKIFSPILLCFYFPILKNRELIPTAKECTSKF